MNLTVEYFDQCRQEEISDVLTVKDIEDAVRILSQHSDQYLENTKKYMNLMRVSLIEEVPFEVVSNFSTE